MANEIELRIWGTRGSVPCGSAEFMEFGGDTSCYTLQIGDVLRFLDAGTGITRASKQLTPNIGRAYLNLSHGHADHLNMGCAGSMYFNNLENGIYLTGNENAKNSLDKFFDGEDLWPVPLSQLGGLNKAFYILEGGETIQYPDSEMKTISNYHPPKGMGGSIGYRFNIPTTDGNVSVVYTTDLEFDYTPGGIVQPHAAELKAKYVNFIRGADVLLADTQNTHEEYNVTMPFVRGFGHPTVEQIVDLANEAGVKTIIGTHHAPYHTDDIMKSLETHVRDYAIGEGFRGDFIYARDGMRISLGNTPVKKIDSYKIAA
ncbi:hypothetical protein HQ489_04180 [Candidatus Woesearchaeota archaeon]|nr:hypothetical protein [Candidatus Woesearchaeota archaeon]